jgi:chemotaxis protein methyltransferase CheR
VLRGTVISPDDYRFLSALLLEGDGLSLGEGKDYLLESRLVPVAVAAGHGDLDTLVRALRQKRDPKLTRTVCEAMTTNETSFFRDGAPFTFLRDTVLPELVAARQRQRSLRIWCAAASTGQEPYSIAMVLALLTPSLADWQVEILATDYASEILARARAGTYNQFEVQRGLPITHLVRFFTQADSGWRINDDLKRRVTFQQNNLLDPYAHLGSFDIIFCRNVLIYFDANRKRDVLGRLANVLAPGGYLFLGGAESPLNLTERLVRVAGASCSVYARSDAPARSGASRPGAAPAATRAGV